MSGVSRREIIRSGGMLTAAIALGLLPRYLHAQATTAPLEQPPKDPGFATNPISVKEIAPGLKVLSGPGGNITLLLGSDGPVMIDSGVPQRSENVVSAVEGAADGSAPRMLINTHWHLDHTGGNQAVADAGAEAIVAHDNTLLRMSSDQKITFFGLTFPAQPVPARPIITFPDQLTIRKNHEVLRLHHLGPAHTDSDIVIFFEHANVITTGDLVFNGVFPFIDYDSGGNIEGMISASEQILKMTDSQTKIVPGHGPVATRDDLIRFHDMLTQLKDRLSKFAARGATLQEVQTARPFADLDAAWGQRFLHGSNIIHMIYPHLIS